MKLRISHMLVNESERLVKTVNGTEQKISASIICEGGRAFNLTEKQLNLQCRVNSIRTYDNRLQNLSAWNKLARLVRNGEAEFATTSHKKDEEYIDSEGVVKKYQKDWVEEKIVALNPKEIVANQQAMMTLKSIEDDWKSQGLDLSGITGMGENL